MSVPKNQWNIYSKVQLVQLRSFFRANACEEVLSIWPRLKGKWSLLSCLHTTKSFLPNGCSFIILFFFFIFPQLTNSLTKFWVEKAAILENQHICIAKKWREDFFAECYLIRRRMDTPEKLQRRRFGPLGQSDQGRSINRLAPVV